MAKTTKQRSKHHGTLERRGNIYRARWEYNGRVYTRTTGTGNIREAEKRLEELTRPFWTTDDKEVLQHLKARVETKADDLAEMEAGKPGFTMMQCWAYFHENYKEGKCDPEMMISYEQWFWIFVDWLKVFHPEITELGQVSEREATDYGKFLLAGTACEPWNRFPRPRRPVRGTTHNRHMNALSLIWRTVAKVPESKLGENPFFWDRRTDTGLPRITLRRADRPHRRRAMSDLEIHKVLCAAQGEIRGLIAMGYYAGLRLKDCVLMKWDNIDLANRIISTRSYKTDEATDTCIHPALWKILVEEVKTDSGYLFPNSAAVYNRSRGGRVWLSAIITKVYRSVGIETQYKPEGSDLQAVPDCTFHSLRHSFNSSLQRIGFERRTRQALMGHKTSAMTAHYEHDYADAPLALPDLLTGDGTPTEDKVAQMKQLFASMSDSERETAQSLLLTQQAT